MGCDCMSPAGPDAGAVSNFLVPGGGDGRGRRGSTMVASPCSIASIRGVEPRPEVMAFESLENHNIQCRSALPRASLLPTYF